MFGKIVFNVLAFTLFIMMFLKFIKRNETSYVYLLILQFVGIAIEFVELITYKNLNVVLKLLMYVLYQYLFSGWNSLKKLILQRFFI